MTELDTTPFAASLQNLGLESLTVSAAKYV
jgi:hypothetical protein